ncbi:MAG: hypothetical protein AABN33_01845 [Acidobacteriota bacterium]
MSAQVRERVSRSEVRSLRVTRMPFGLSIGEAIAALLAVVLLGCVVAYYFSSLRPEQDRLLILEAELAEQQKNIIANASTSGTDTPVVDLTKNALETLEAFKSNHLKSFSSGRIALIKEINALAKKNNVALTSGIDMGSSMGESSPEGENTGANGQKSASRRKKADEILSVIPSVTFRFAVFGPYSNLRTFINQFEHEKQFLVINSINLANQEARTASRRSRGEGASGIMLTIEMTAYFQPM